MQKQSFLTPLFQSGLILFPAAFTALETISLMSVVEVPLHHRKMV
jgi:hypothetical protein